jgi:hypothetical protein
MQLRSFARIALLAVLATAGGVTAAAAQGLGIKFGPTFATFSDDVLDFDTRTGVQGGLFIGGGRASVLGAQTEINWLRKKADQISPGSEPREIRIDYLQIPLLLRLNIGSSSPSGFGVYGIAGPAVELKIADEIAGITLDEGFEGADVSLVFGGGIEAARLILEGRYQKGFRRINKSFSDFAEIKTQAFTILFGIRFK